jgi:hypothetical protein
MKNIKKLNKHEKFKQKLKKKLKKTLTEIEKKIKKLQNLTCFPNKRCKGWIGTDPRLEQERSNNGCFKQIEISQNFCDFFVYTGFVQILKYLYYLHQWYILLLINLIN